MPRKKNFYPTPKLRMKSGSWCVRWSWERKIYEFSTGYAEHKTDDAERILTSFKNAIYENEWPTWTEGIKPIQKWRKIFSANPQPEESPRIEITPESVLAEWIIHYTASTTEDQVHERSMHLKNLAENYNLLKLTSTQASQHMMNLKSKAPERYLSDIIIKVMGKKTLYREKIIELLQPEGIEFTRGELSTALKNRNVFKFIPDVVNGEQKHRIGKYKAIKKPDGLSPRSRNNYLMTYRMFYRWAEKKGYVTENPFEDIRQAQTQEYSEIDYFERNERKQILNCAAGTPYELAVKIAFYAGLRLGEIAVLRWENVDLARNWIYITKSKNKHPRNVPVSPELAKALKKEKKSKGLVISHWAKYKNYDDAARADMIEIQKQLPKLGKRIRFNVFRHTYGSLFAQAGKTIDQLCALMGNTRDVCERHYANLIPKSSEKTDIHLID